MPVVERAKRYIEDNLDAVGWALLTLALLYFVFPLSTLSIVMFSFIVLSGCGAWMIIHSRRANWRFLQRISLAIPGSVAALSGTICFLSPLLAAKDRIYLTHSDGLTDFGSTLTTVFGGTDYIGATNASLYNRADIVRTTLFPLIAGIFGKEIKIIERDDACLTLPLTMLRRRPAGLPTSPSDTLMVMFAIVEPRKVTIEPANDFIVRQGGGMTVAPMIDRRFATLRSVKRWSCVRSSVSSNDELSDAIHASALDYGLENLSVGNFDDALHMVDFLRFREHTAIEDLRTNAIYAFAVLNRSAGNVGAMQAAEITIGQMPKIRTLVASRQIPITDPDSDVLYWSLGVFRDTLRAVRDNPIYERFAVQLADEIRSAGFSALLEDPNEDQVSPDRALGETQADSLKQKEWNAILDLQVPTFGWTRDQNLDIEWALIDKIRWEYEDWLAETRMTPPTDTDRLEESVTRHTAAIDQVLERESELATDSVLPIKLVADRIKCIMRLSDEQKSLGAAKLMTLPRDRASLRCLDTTCSSLVIDMQILARINPKGALQHLVKNCGGKSPGNRWWSLGFLNCFAAATAVLPLLHDHKSDFHDLKEPLRRVLANVRGDSSTSPFMPGVGLCATIENRLDIDLGKCRDQVARLVTGSDKKKDSKLWPIY